MSSVASVEIDVSKCPVSGVVVYLDRADVTRSVEVELNPGENEVIVKQLSSAIDSDSIRVEGRGQATIGEVKYREKHVTTADEDDTATEATTSTAVAATKELERERSRLNMSHTRIKSSLDRLKKQRSLLENLAGKMKPGQNKVDQGANGAFSFGAKAETTETGSLFGDLLSGDTLDGVLSFMEFYETRTRKLDEEVVAIEMEENVLVKQLQAVEKNLQLRLGKAGKDGAESGTDVQRSVAISVTCDKKSMKATLFLSYVVMEAGWAPQYDLRVFSKDGLLKIHYFALISQCTGEDWDEAPLVLSTSQPSIGGSPPDLGTKKLSFQIETQQQFRYPQSYGFSEVSSSRSQQQQVAFRGVHTGDMYGFNDESESSLNENYLSQAPQLTVPTAEVTGTVTSTSFEIPRRTTIPADRTSHKVSVAIIDLKPSFEYETVPKLVAHAFMKAKVKNTSQYALLQGPANVFLDNNFISKTSLDDVSPHEDFTCFLGVDPAVRVVYKPVRRFKENTGIFSKSTLVTMRQNIEVKNTRLEVVKIKVTDALAISSEDKIKVSLIKPDVTRKEPNRPVTGGTVSLTKANLLEWRLDIPASSHHVVELAYSVEHPADSHAIQGL